NTQENGIVRIHAARLRRILDVYYKSHGIIDFIRISIPKGTYIPRFTKNSNDHFSNDHNDKLAVKEPVTIGIIPFTHLSCDESDIAILKGIELQLTTALMNFDNFYVIGHQMIAALFKKDKDIHKLVN